MLLADLLVEVTWDTPSPEVPIPKATLDVGAHVLTANFHSLPRGFPQIPSCNRTDTFCKKPCY